MNDFSTTRPATRSNRIIVRLAALVAAVSALTLNGCASAPQPMQLPALPEDPSLWAPLVVKRAEARWQLMSEGKYEAAFGYFTDASKKDADADTLRAVWSKFRPEGAVAEPPTCSKEEGCLVTMMVKMMISIPRVGFRQQIVPMVERWMPEKGDFSLIRK